jgi:hypothetical protein
VSHAKGLDFLLCAPALEVMEEAVPREPSIPWWKVILQYWPLIALLCGQVVLGFRWKWTTDQKFEDAAKDRSAILAVIKSHVSDHVVHLTMKDRVDTFQTKGRRGKGGRYS